MSDAAAEAGVGDDPSAFVRKWRAHWPEWPIAEVFVAPPLRERVDAWEALQYELTEAAWGGDDARPGEAKLGWWMEELDGWAKGRRRHPIGGVLQRLPAPWSELARAIPSLAASRERPRDSGDAWTQVDHASAAAANIEPALFDHPTDARIVAACWLHSRLARHPATAVPLADLARGSDESARTWPRQLLASWPHPAIASRPRKLLAALAVARLRRGDAAAGLSPWSTLRAGWRAARE